jgi:hypothetical protein
LEGKSVRIFDYVRGEERKEMHFVVYPKRINSVFRYEAHIYEADEEGDSTANSLARETADFQWSLKFYVWSRCRKLKKQRREEEKGDPSSWTVKL